MKDIKIVLIIMLLVLSIGGSTINVNASKKIVSLNNKTVEGNEAYVLTLYKEKKIIYEDKSYIKKSIEAMKEAFKVMPEEYIRIFIEYEYKIKFVKEIDEIKGTVKGSTGCISFKEKIIYFENKIDVASMKETIIHEFNHLFDKIKGMEDYRKSINNTKQFQKIYKTYKNEYNCHEYFKANSTEFFANVMMDYYINKDNVPDKIINYIEKMLLDTDCI